mgnify:FL=1
MMEDLLKIKLEMEQARKYVPLVGLDEDDVIAASKEEGKTLLEFQAMENTDEFIMQCENLMKEAIILLSRNNIPYDVIRLTSSVGILCTSELIEFLKNKYEELYNGNDMIDCHRIIFENIGTNVILKYVPMNFSFDIVESGISKCNGELLSLRLYMGQDFIPPIKELPEMQRLLEKNIFGIVDFEKFVKKMQLMDYSIEFGNNGFNEICKSDYKNFLMKSSIDTNIHVAADFRTLKLKK